MFGNNNYNLAFEVVAEADAATVAINTLAGGVHTWNCGQDTTVNFSGDGALTMLTITCDATPRTITWGTNIRPTASSTALTALKKNSFLFVYDGGEHILISSAVGT